MYIHLGQGTVVKKSDIIGIFDLDTATVSKRTRIYLRRAEINNELITITNELPKAFVVTQRQKGAPKKIYISQLSSVTLLKRSEFLKTENFTETESTNGGKY